MRAKASTGVEDFRSLLRREVEAICADEGMVYDTEAHRGFAFQRWCSYLLARHEGMDEDDPIDHFASNDLKVDFIAEDADEKVLYIAQTKFASVHSNPPIDETEVNDFFSRHHIFLTGKWSGKYANETLHDYIVDYGYRLENGRSIHFYFFSSGKKSDRVDELVLEKEN